MSRFIVLLGVKPSPYVIWRPLPAVRELKPQDEARFALSHWDPTGYVLPVLNAYGHFEDAEVYVRRAS